MERYDVRTPNVSVHANLSGGNQQKMVVARVQPACQAADRGTAARSIDVGSIEFIHQQIVAKRDEGAAVCWSAPKLDEIMALSDRIAVMYKARS